MEVDIVTQMGDVPYASYFNAQEFITVKPDGGKCKLSIEAAIVFNKGTYLKNTLIKRTLADLKSDWEVKINLK